MNLNTTGNLAPALQTFYDRALLERGLPWLIHARFGQNKPLPKKNGDTIKFRRYNGLESTPVPLAEGVSPTGKIVSVTELTATPKQYGDAVFHSDLVDMKSQDPVLAEYAVILGEQAGETVDEVYRDVINGGSNVFYAGSRTDSSIDTRVEVAATVSSKDFQKIKEQLIRDKAKPLAVSDLKATNKTATQPVPKAFWCIVHPDLEMDLKNMSGWVSVHNYPNSTGAFEEEIGALPEANMRFLVTQKAKVWTDGGGTAGSTYRSTTGTSADVYSILILGANSYGLVPLGGDSLKFFTKELGSAGADDPLNQRGSVGWKASTTAKILQDEWMVRYEVAATVAG